MNFAFLLAHGILREFVAEILEREFRREERLFGLRDSFGKLSEKTRHALGGFQMASELRARRRGGVKCLVIADESENVEHFSMRVACGETPFVAKSGETHCRAISTAA